MDTDYAKVIEDFDVAEGITIWYLGGPSVAIKTPRTLIYLDLFTGLNPVSELHKATVDILDPANILTADAVLATHHDTDHCHRESLTPIHDNTDALRVGPNSTMKLFREWGFDERRMVELAAYQSLQLKDLRIWAMPCNDYFDKDANSYILESGGVTLFDGGDTLYYSGYIKVGQQFDIDLAMLNFARNPPGEIYYMNHAHVARTAEELNTRILLPKHFDLWEEFLDDPELLIPLLDTKGIQVKILKQGEYISLLPQNSGK